MKAKVIVFLIIFSFKNVYAENISNRIFPVSYFTNHVSILKNVEEDLKKFRSVCLTGYSGVGKTQLARMFADQNHKKYKIIWFLDSSLDLKEESLKLVKELNNRYGKNIISEEKENIIHNLLNYLKDKKSWLIVIDDLKLEATPDIDKFVDLEHNGNLIFCCQNDNFSNNKHKIIQLNKFSPQNGKALASQILEKKHKNMIDFFSNDFFLKYPILIVQGAKLINELPSFEKDKYKKEILKSADKIIMNIEISYNQLHPSAQDLAKKITLLNKNGVSKNFLKVVMNNDSLDDDLFELQKFGLINSNDKDQDNPTYEMHELVGLKIKELSKDLGKTLEEITQRLQKSLPNSIIELHKYRNMPTFRENLEILCKNLQNYTASKEGGIVLNIQLATKHINELNTDKAAELIFSIENNFKNNQENIFNNLEEKQKYVEYLVLVGTYYRRLGDFDKAIEYFEKAKEMSSLIEGFYNFKSNLYLQLGKTYLSRGKIDVAESIINLSEVLFKEKKLDEADYGLVIFAKARLNFMKGDYKKSLKLVDSAIERFLERGINRDDIYFTGPYMLKAEILNNLGDHKSALMQLDELYDMQRDKKAPTHEVFGRISNQVAKAKLFANEIKEAQQNITKAIDIFMEDKIRNPAEANYIEDQELANSYTIQGDIYLQSKNYQEALKFFNKARKIYFYSFKENAKNVEYISDLYFNGGFAAYKCLDKTQFADYRDTQIAEFGMEHPNSKKLNELSF